MTEAAAPVSVRSQALAIIANHLPAPSVSDALAAIGVNGLAHLLCDLEDAFDIGLDADDAWPHGTVGGLIDIVEARAAAPHIGRQVIALDDERAKRGLPLYAPPVKLTTVTPGIVRAEPHSPPQGEMSAEPTEGVSAPPPAAHAVRDLFRPMQIAVPSDLAWEAHLRRAERIRRQTWAAAAVFLLAIPVLAKLALG